MQFDALKILIVGVNIIISSASVQGTFTAVRIIFHRIAVEQIFSTYSISYSQAADFHSLKIHISATALNDILMQITRKSEKSQLHKL